MLDVPEGDMSRGEEDESSGSRNAAANASANTRDHSLVQTCTGQKMC